MMNSGLSSASTLSPLKVGFDSHVELTIHGAFLQTAGLMQCDPMARVQLLTVTKTYPRGNNNNNNRNSGGGGSGPSSSAVAPLISMSSIEMGQTSQKLFTAFPVFDQTISFYVRSNRSLTSLAGSPPTALALSTHSADTTASAAAAAIIHPPYATRQHSPSSLTALDATTQAGDCVEDYVVIRIEDGEGGHFFGQAYCPFSPHCSSHAARESPVRVMLQPRHGHDCHDPLFRRDCAALAAQQLDSFGYVSISWTVQTLPHGGVLIGAGGGVGEGESETAALARMPIPPSVGLAIRALWLARWAQTDEEEDAEEKKQACTGASISSPASTHMYPSSTSLQDDGVRRSIALELGGPERYPLTNWETAVRLTIRGATELPPAVFYCTSTNTNTNGSDYSATTTTTTMMHARSTSLHLPRRQVAVLLPMPALHLSASYDRDIHWTCPVRSPQGEDDGLLLVRVRLTRAHVQPAPPESTHATSAAANPSSPPAPQNNINSNGNSNHTDADVRVARRVLCTEPWPCPHINEPQHQENYLHEPPTELAIAAASAAAGLHPSLIQGSCNPFASSSSSSSSPFFSTMSPLHDVNSSLPLSDTSGLLRRSAWAKAPHTPLTAYDVAQWESVAHWTEAQERRWRLSCVVAAQPTAEHVRHIFDVLMGRSTTTTTAAAAATTTTRIRTHANTNQLLSSPDGEACHESGGGLDPRVAELASAMMGRAVSELTGADLKAVMVSCAFHARGVSVQEAARFCFMALRRDVETAVRVEEVHFMWTHCLLEKTVEMSSGERRRWVSELLGPDTAVVSFAHFHRLLVMNYAVWAQLGVPLTVDMRVSSGRGRVCGGWGESSVCHGRAAAAAPWRRAHRQAELWLEPRAGQTASGGLLPVFGYGETALLPTTAVVPVARSAAPASARPQNGSSETNHANETNSNSMNNNTNNNNTHSGGSAYTINGAMHNHLKASESDEATAPVAKPASPLWRSFVVRVVSSNRYFSVTAHVHDTIADVMAMTENSVGIRASQQEWRLQGRTLLQPSLRVGQTSLGLSSAMKGGHAADATSSSSAAAADAAADETNVVWVTEQESSLRLQFHWAARQKRWQERMASTEKILRVRAAVQRRTLIPLSRCVLKVQRGVGPALFLQDRHTLAHYHLHSGDVIEVVQE